MLQSPARETSILDLPSLPALLAVAILGLLFFFAPTELNGFWPADFNFWPQSLLALCLALCAVLLAVSRLPVSRPSPVFWLLAAFGAWNALSAIFASYAHDAWMELARITAPLAVYFLARLLPARARWFLVGALLLGLCWPALLAFLDFLQTRNARQFGPFNNPNYFAAALGAALPFALVFPLHIARHHRGKAFTLVAWLPFVVLLLGLVSTGSKGGFLATLLAFPILGVALKIARPQAFGHAIRKSLPFLLVGGLLFGAVTVKTVGPRLLQARTSDDNSTQFRFYLWQGTIEMAKAAPVFGHGPGSFPSAYPRFAPAGRALTAHQSWLQIAAENGVPALLLLVLTTAAAIAAARRQLAAPDFLLAAGGIGALSAIWAHGFFDAGWSTLLVPLVFALALAFCEAPPPVEIETERETGLNLPLLAGALALGLVGYGSQIGAGGADLERLADQQFDQGALPLALQNATAATLASPGNAAAWSLRGVLEQSLGTGGETSFQKALALQPQRAFHHVNLARFHAQTNPRRAEEFYARAVQLDPHNTRLLLDRARFRLESKSGDAYADLRRLLELWESPVGTTVALDEWINLDFARATTLIWPRLSRPQKAKYRAKALSDIARAKIYQARNDEILAAVGNTNSLEANRDLPELEATLNSLS